VVTQHGEERRLEVDDPVVRHTVVVEDSALDAEVLVAVGRQDLAHPVGTHRDASADRSLWNARLAPTGNVVAKDLFAA